MGVRFRISPIDSGRLAAGESDIVSFTVSNRPPEVESPYVETFEDRVASDVSIIRGQMQIVEPGLKGSGYGFEAIREADETAIVRLPTIFDYGSIELDFDLRSGANDLFLIFQSSSVPPNLRQAYLLHLNAGESYLARFIDYGGTTLDAATGVVSADESVKVKVRRTAVGEISVHLNNQTEPILYAIDSAITDAGMVFVGMNNRDAEVSGIMVDNLVVMGPGEPGLAEELEENFEDGVADNFLTVGGSWTIMTPGLRGSNFYFQATSDEAVTRPPVIFNAGLISVDFMIADGPSGEFIVRFQADNDYRLATQYYDVVMHTTSFSEPVDRLDVTVDGETTTLATADSVLLPGSTAKLSIERRLNGEIDVYIDAATTPHLTSVDRSIQSLGRVNLALIKSETGARGGLDNVLINTDQSARLIVESLAESFEDGIADDFTMLVGGWDVVAPGLNGSAYLYQPTTSPAAVRLPVKQNVGAVEADFLLRDFSSGRIAIRIVSDEGDYDSVNNYYQIELFPITLASGQDRIVRKWQGEDTLLATATPVLVPDETRRVRIERRESGEIDVFVGSAHTVHLTAVDTFLAEPGRVTIMLDEDQAVTQITGRGAIDNVMVSPDVTERRLFTELAEDFEDGAADGFIDTTGQWATASPGLSGSDLFYQPQTEGAATNPPVILSHGVIEADFVIRDGVTGNFTVRFQSNLSPSSTKAIATRYYSVVINTEGQQDAIQRTVNSVTTNVATTPSVVAPGTTARVRIERMADGRIRVFLGDSKIPHLGAEDSVIIEEGLVEFVFFEDPGTDPRGGIDNVYMNAEFTPREFSTELTEDFEDGEANDFVVSLGAFDIGTPGLRGSTFFYRSDASISVARPPVMFATGTIKTDMVLRDPVVGSFVLRVQADGVYGQARDFYEVALRTKGTGRLDTVSRAINGAKTPLAAATSVITAGETVNVKVQRRPNGDIEVTLDDEREPHLKVTDSAITEAGEVALIVVEGESVTPKGGLDNLVVSTEVEPSRLISEDFEDGDMDDFLVAEGAWEVASPGLGGSGFYLQAQAPVSVVEAPAVFDIGTIEVDFILRDASAGNFIVRFQANDTETDFYDVSLFVAGAADKQDAIVRSYGGLLTTLAAVTPVVPAGDVTRLVIERKEDGTIAVFLNESTVPHLRASDDLVTRAGKVFFMLVEGEGIEERGGIDNVAVTPAISGDRPTDPTAVHEDFEDRIADGFNTITGGWGIASPGFEGSSYYYQSQSPTSVVRPPVFFDTGTISVDLMVRDPIVGHAGIRFQSDDGFGKAGPNFYDLTLIPVGRGQDTLLRSVNGIVTTIASAPAVLQPGVGTNVRIERRLNGEIDVFINGAREPHLSATDSSLMSEGRVDFVLVEGGAVAVRGGIDNVDITEEVNPGRVLMEDFEDGVANDFVDLVGAWQVSSPGLLGSTQYYQAAAPTAATAPPVIFDVGTVEVDFVMNDPASGRFLARIQADADFGEARTFYEISISPEGAKRAQDRIFRSVNGIITQLATTNSDVTAGTPATLRIERTLDHQLNVFLDDDRAPHLSVTDAGITSVGKVSFVLVEGAAIPERGGIDNVAVSTTAGQLPTADELSEDFEDGIADEFVTPVGTWDIAGPGLGGSGLFYRAATPVAVARLPVLFLDGSIEMDFLIRDAARGNVIVRFLADDNFGAAKTFYELSLFTTGQGARRDSLSRSVNGIINLLAQADPVANVDEEAQLTIERREDGRIEVFVGDAVAPHFSLVDTAIAEEGGIDLILVEGASVSPRGGLDNIRVGPSVRPRRVLEEDFEDGQANEFATILGLWEVASPGLTGSARYYRSGSAVSATRPPVVFETGGVECDVVLRSGASSSLIVRILADDDFGASNTFYDIVLFTTEAGASRDAIFRSVNGLITTLAVASPQIVAHTDTKVTVQRDEEGTISVFLRGSRLAHLAATDDEIAGLGLVNFILVEPGATRGGIDNVVISPEAAPPPPPVDDELSEDFEDATADTFATVLGGWRLSTPGLRGSQFFYQSTSQVSVTRPLVTFGFGTIGLDVMLRDEENGGFIIRFQANDDFGEATSFYDVSLFVSDPGGRQDSIVRSVGGVLTTLVSAPSIIDAGTVAGIEVRRTNDGGIAVHVDGADLPHLSVTDDSLLGDGQVNFALLGGATVPVRGGIDNVVVEPGPGPGEFVESFEDGEAQGFTSVPRDFVVVSPGLNGSFYAYEQPSGGPALTVPPVTFARGTVQADVLIRDLTWGGVFIAFQGDGDYFSASNTYVVELYGIGVSSADRIARVEGGIATELTRSATHVIAVGAPTRIKVERTALGAINVYVGDSAEPYMSIIDTALQNEGQVNIGFLMGFGESERGVVDNIVIKSE